ncbi:2'-5' RNA ligase family protein [Sphingomonas sp. ID1715]|uniref:2'-5' RNA ligase family protein n=1 Tax=Sphingomonas sp. ID1715 TaxID=1656898 RepID=UPI0014889D12|nr:2'-5' RNA ligase family protein [Sphingomonas sp. ID1715]NNM75691.1 2'-5' RNA ligase family protein [Sphingomonas sp. ID1715]
MSAPIIVTALLGASDFAWADGLRRRHFPPERNQVPAHITLFHHLPPSLADEVREQLKAECRAKAPAARLSGLRHLGRGVAYVVDSDRLAAIRQRLVEHFTGMLTPQDQAPWRPHITVQNKVEPKEAKALLAELERSFAPRPLQIAGLASWWYRGGPWEPLSEHRFR